MTQMQILSGGEYGEMFDPLSPDPSKIRIESIAHSLSMQCRYNGHVLKFYSVAQHSYHIWMAARTLKLSWNEQMWALLHDAPEAYIGDITRPVRKIPEVRNALERIDVDLEHAVAEKFGLTYDIPDSILKLDGDILSEEKKYLLEDTRPEDLYLWTIPQSEFPGVVSRFPLRLEPHLRYPMLPNQAKKTFLGAFNATKEERC